MAERRAANRPWGFARWRWELLGQVAGRTLEIGCGWGHNFDHYSAAALVAAFDYDPARVRDAARRRAPIPLSIADAQHLAWADRQFDSVVGTLVFCSIPQPHSALQEIRRVLKPTGKLYLLEHVRSHHDWLGMMQDALNPAWHWVTGGCNLNRDTEGTLRAAGFAVEQRRVLYAGLLKLIVARLDA
jgi:ubiquinone/menaquinone biosynthesis C-methylase UbiE